MKNLFWTTTEIEKETKNANRETKYKRRGNVSIYCEAIAKGGRSIPVFARDLKLQEAVNEVKFYVGILEEKTIVFEKKQASLTDFQEKLNNNINEINVYEREIQENNLSVGDKSLRKRVIEMLQGTNNEIQQEIEVLEKEMPVLIEEIESQQKNLAEIFYIEEENTKAIMKTARKKEPFSVKTLSPDARFNIAAAEMRDCLFSIIDKGGDYCRTTKHKVYKYGSYYQGTLENIMSNLKELHFSIDTKSDLIGLFDENLNLIGEGKDFKNMKWFNDFGNEVIVLMHEELCEINEIMARRNYIFQGENKLKQVLSRDLIKVKGFA